MKVLIIGLGSIAKKHIKALKDVDITTQFYALRSDSGAEQYEDVKNIYSLEACPEIDFVIISNPTAFHADAIKKVTSLKKPLFIEKPPFHNLDDVNEILNLVSENNLKTYTAFNLRFLDCLKYVKKHIQISKVQEVNVYCGSYLPNWRSNQDYKSNYSADPEMGGGAHLDLIHELDYVLWFFGQPLEVRSIKRSKSKIDIKSVDYANYALIYESFVVNIILNYYRRDAKRTCEIVFDDTTWNVNLLKNNIINFENNALLFQSDQTGLDTYKDQMEYFVKTISGNEILSNPLSESVNTLKIALS